MADQNYQVQHQGYQQQPNNVMNSFLPNSNKGPSSSQVIAVATILPVGGLLLLLAGITLAGTIVGLAVTTPLFVIFSPVLIPAALIIGLAVTGILSSGAFGVTALSAFSWMANYIRARSSSLPDQWNNLKERARETVDDVGQRTREMGSNVKNKAQEKTGKAYNKAQESTADRTQEGSRTP